MTPLIPFDAGALRGPVFAAMRAVPRWGLCKCVPDPRRPGKYTKIPLNPRTLDACDTHRPEAWVTCEESLVLAAACGPAYYPTFTFAAGEPRWFLDVDNCRTGDTWSDTATQLLALLAGAAVEVSASGTGLHFFGQGQVPPHGTRCGALGLEFYTGGRFVCITGISAAGSDASDHTGALAQLVASCFPPPAPLPAGPAGTDGPCPEWRGPADDDELLARAMRSAGSGAAFGNRASFADLWTANAEVLARAYPDPSREYDASSADAALAQHLAFWTGKDAPRIGRLMRRSALARDKWEREDYMLRTVSGAVARQVQVLQDAAPAAGDAETAWSALTMLPNAALTGAWLAAARPLPRAEAEKLILQVATRTGLPAPSLRAELKAAVAAEVVAESRALVVEQTGDRLLLQHMPDSPHIQAAQIERAIVDGTPPGAYVSFGGVPCEIVERPLPMAHATATPNMPVWQIEPLNGAGIHKLMARTTAIYKPRKGGVQEMVEHPAALREILLHQKSGSVAPVVSGIITHPVVLPGGAILSVPGLDPTTRLFVTAEAAVPCRAYSQPEAAAALEWIRGHVFAGFAFATRLDADVAITALLTMFQRRVLDLAPGFAALANHQASGKTTACRVMHLACTGRDMPVASLPVGESEEAEKALTAMLMRNPEALCFDNVPGGYNFRSRALTQIITSTTFDSRVLGASRIVSCPTNVMLMLTGNNLRFSTDEASRWLVSWLTTRAGGGPVDIVGHVLGLRAQFLTHAAGILAGYQLAGPGGMGAPSRFTAWDRLVRFPVMWAGAGDAAASFAQNEAHGDDQQATRTLVTTLRAIWGDSKFGLREVAAYTALGGDAALRNALGTSLEMLNVTKPESVRALSHRFAELVRRPVDGWWLDRAPFDVSGGPAYCVRSAG